MLKRAAVYKRPSMSAITVVALSAAQVSRALAHADQPPAPHDLWSAWNLEAWLISVLVLASGLYLRGLQRLWSRAGSFRGISGLQFGSFALGMGLLFIALISPVDALGEALSAAHMAQHMLLFFAAPFLILAAPLPVYLWALPLSWRRRVGSKSKQSWIALPWRALTTPIVAWLGYALALWIWHAPGLYQAALQTPLLHDLEHFSFFATALLFWWVVFRSAPRTTALGMLFTTMLHSGLLAALMTFSSRPWYPIYSNSTAAWGLTPLEDQHLAGLLMWVPGSIGYLLAGLGLVALWLQKLEAESARRNGAGSNEAFGTEWVFRRVSGQADLHSLGRLKGEPHGCGQ